MEQGASLAPALGMTAGGLSSNAAQLRSSGELSSSADTAPFTLIGTAAQQLSGASSAPSPAPSQDADGEVLRQVLFQLQQLNQKVTQMDQRLAQVDHRVAQVEQGVAQVGQRVSQVEQQQTGERYVLIAE